MARSSLSSLLATVIYLVILLPFSFAQDAPLFIQGGLQDATATDDTYNTGGTIAVNGFNMEVPKNLQVQFPAAWVPWKDFVSQKDSMLGYEINVMRPPPSLLALTNDGTPRSLATSSTENPLLHKSWHMSFLRDLVAVLLSPLTLRTAA